MLLFKAFFKIARKMLPALSIYFFIYLGLIFFLSSSAQKNIDSTFQAKELDICIVDEDHSLASEALRSYLASMHHLIALENNPAVLQDHLYYRHISYVLTIPAGFEKNLLAGQTEDLLTNVKLPDSASGVFIDQQITPYLDSVRLYLVAGYTLTDAIELTNAAISNAAKVDTVIFDDKNLIAKKDIFYFYQYLSYILVVLLLCGMAPILSIFHKKDLANRIACSALSLKSRTVQLTVSAVLYAFLTWMLLVLPSLIFYGQHAFTANALYATLNSLAFLFVATAIAFFASNFALDYGVTNMISNVLGLGMSFLCGVFVPQPMLSESTLKIARFLPAYWYIRANNMLGGLSDERFDIHFYWTALGIQLLFAVAIFAITMVFVRMKKQKA